MEGRASTTIITTVIWKRSSLIALWRDWRRKLVAGTFVQNVGVLTLANVTGAALNVLQGILVARWLGPELYGVAAIVMTYPNLVYGLFDARTVTASVKYLGEYHAVGQSERALAMCKLGCLVDLAVACFSALVVASTASFAAERMAHHPAVTGLMIVYAAALIPRAPVGTSTAVLSTLGQFPVLAALEIAGTLLRVLLILAFVLAGWQVAGVVWGSALAAAIGGLFYGLLATLHSRRVWGASILRAKLGALAGKRREILSFLAFTDLSALVGIIPRQFDVLALGYFRNPTDVGYYKLAKSLAGVANYLVGPLKSVTYPELARLWGLGRHLAFSHKIRKLATWIGLPLGFIVLVAAASVPWVLPLLVGDRYLPAVQSTQILFVSSAISLAFYWLRLVHLARNYIRQTFIVGTSITLVFASLYPFVVDRWGFLGASAWMLGLTAVTTAGSLTLLWWYSRNDFKKPTR